MGIMEYSRSVYERLCEAVDRYDRIAAQAYGKAVRYDNPLGVRVQTSVGNHFEDCILDMAEAEQACRRLGMAYTCSLLTTYNVVWQSDGITDTQKRILTRRAGSKPETYKKSAVDLGLRNEDKARFLYNAATAKIEHDLSKIR